VLTEAAALLFPPQIEMELLRPLILLNNGAAALLYAGVRFRSDALTYIDSMLRVRMLASR
jgi:hypothetical protein